MISSLEKFIDIFKQDIGTYKCEKIKLEGKPDTKPIFMNPRQVAYKFKEKVDEILDKLEENTMLTRVENS